MNTETRWRMPERGTPLRRLWGRLKAALDKNINYATGRALGFPGTPPIPETVRIFSAFAERHPNNIGVHTLGGGAAEFGFEGTQELEREAVYTAASLVGADDPETQVDGYVCGGGTEGNDEGLWVGRNALLADRSMMSGWHNGIAVMTSWLTHYSAAKLFDRLFRGNPANRFMVLGTNELGEVTPNIVRASVRLAAKEGHCRFLLFLNAGTTNLGSVDQIERICELVPELEKEYRAKIYVHVDAAFGGFVLPFLEPGTKFGFHNPAVSSMVLDPQKMGFAPYPAGIFLCRKKLLENVRTDACYLAGHADHTVSGSRSGAMAAAVWTLLKVHGRKDYEDTLRRCLDLQAYLRNLLEEIPGVGPSIRFYPERMNVLTARFPEEAARVLEDKQPGGLSMSGRWCIPTDRFPNDLGRLTFGENGSIEKPVLVHRFVAMPHYRREAIEEFVDELEAKLADK